MNANMLNPGAAFTRKKNITYLKKIYNACLKKFLPAFAFILGIVISLQNLYFFLGKRCSRHMQDRNFLRCQMPPSCPWGRQRPGPQAKVQIANAPSLAGIETFTKQLPQGRGGGDGHCWIYSNRY